MPHRSIRTVLAAIAVTLTLLPAIGHAGPSQSKESETYESCSDWAHVVGYLSCKGSRKVNDGVLGKDTIEYDDDLYELIAKSGGADDPFAAISGGTLTFESPLVGSFVLAMKAGDEYSLYEFYSETGLNSIKFDLQGGNANGNGQGKGKNKDGDTDLSYAMLYVGSSRQVPPEVTEPSPAAAVPEPGTPALLLAGLAAIGLLASRRKA